MPRVVKIPPASELLTTEEAMAYLKVAQRTLYKFSAAGRLPVYKVGNHNRYWIKDLDAVVARRSA